MSVALSLMIFLMLIPGMLAMCNRWLPRWFCSVMGWHLEPEKKTHNGCSLTGICPRCGKTTSQDSQGNWF